MWAVNDIFWNRLMWMNKRLLKFNFFFLHFYYGPIFLFVKIELKKGYPEIVFLTVRYRFDLLDLGNQAPTDFT